VLKTLAHEKELRTKGYRLAGYSEEPLAQLPAQLDLERQSPGAY